MEENHPRFSQRGVAAPSRYQSKSRKLDTVIVEDGQNPPTKIDENPIWLAKVPSLIKVARFEGFRPS